MNTGHADTDAPHPLYVLDAEAADHLPETIVERISRWLCAIGIVAMVASVAVELVTRNLLGFSFEVSDELGGYIVVAVTFMSLSVCEIHGSYHRMEIIQGRLPRHLQAASRVLFDLLILAFCLVLVWQLGRFLGKSWHSGDVASSRWLTPLWIPRLFMPLGSACLTWSVLRSLLADIAATMRGSAR